jgi:hypothetical protein
VCSEAEIQKVDFALRRSVDTGKSPALLFQGVCQSKSKIFQGTIWATSQGW